MIKYIPMKKQAGLTLVELLIVIAVIAILAAVAFVAIDPASRFAEARNAQRWSDVSTLMEASQQAFVDLEGELTGDLGDVDSDGTTVQIVTDGSASLTCGSYSCSGATESVVSANCEVDLSVMEGDYFAAVPIDPSQADGSADSAYYINYDSGIFTIGACNPEEEKDGNTPTVRVSR